MQAITAASSARWLGAHETHAPHRLGLDEGVLGVAAATHELGKRRQEALDANPRHVDELAGHNGFTALGAYGCREHNLQKKDKVEQLD
jgi:hypothetical protein